MKFFSYTLFFTLLLFNLLMAGGAFSVSTFESISLYWSPDGGATDLSVLVKFRAEGSESWRDGLPMKYNPIGQTDNDAADYRGSLVNLIPNTLYEIELTLQGTETRDTVFAKTWSEDFPIAKTIKVENMGKPLIPLEAGSEAGYVLYDGEGTTIDVGDSANYCMYIVKDYVILRGFTLKNATQHGIFLKDCHNVVIEDCDISGWGDTDDGVFGKNYHSAIFSTSTGIKRIVIQRCRIHNPRWGSNSWKETHNDIKHPQGPQAISFYNGNGNHVIRYNTVWSDDEHMFNDMIGYMDNSGFKGFPNCDTDIYGNFFSHCYDDGIEAEGADRNVRIWGNYIENALIPIANASVTIGPLYVWRNISGKTNSEGGYSAFIKMGYSSDINTMNGYTYLFNNTIAQPEGGGFKGVGKDNRKIRHCVTRNNILHSRSGNSISTSSYNLDYDFDYDLCSGDYPEGEEVHGIKGDPQYVNGAGFDYENYTANYFLKEDAPGYDDGVIIPNFVEKYNGAAPDMGALETGDEPAEYGVNAYIISDIDENDASAVLPKDFYLKQNYPNPFNPSTKIEFGIAKAGNVKLVIYDMLGREVNKIIDSYYSKGHYSYRWEAKDKSGTLLPSGLYVAQIRSGKNLKNIKMILIK